MNDTRLWLYPASLAFGIFCASGTSRLAAPGIDIQLISPDKLAHCLIFGLLATSIIRIPKVRNMGKRGALIAILSVSAFGIFDELRQSLTPGRFVEFNDWVADTTGAILATFVYLKWSLYRTILEWKVPLLKQKRASDLPRLA